MADEYWIIGGDDKEYGPVSLQVLTQWAQERRVVPASRVRKGTAPLAEASSFPELAGLFPPQAAGWTPATPGAPSAAGPAVLPAEFRVWALIGQAWTLVKPHWLPLAAMFFIQVAIGVVPYLGACVWFIIGGAIMVGIWRAILGVVDGRTPTVGMMFEGFDRFGDAFLAALVSGILTALGYLCLIVPGIILTLMWCFKYAVLAETRLGFWEAMHASVVLTEGYRWRLFLLALASIPIVLLGLLVLCVGIFVAVPVVLTSFALAYRFLQRQKGQAGRPA